MISTFAAQLCPPAQPGVRNTDVEQSIAARSGFCTRVMPVWPTSVQYHEWRGNIRAGLRKAWQPASAVWPAAEPAGIARSLRSPCLHGKSMRSLSLRRGAIQPSQIAKASTTCWPGAVRFWQSRKAADLADRAVAVNGDD